MINMYNSFLLTIIAIAVVAFVYFEYNPKLDLYTKTIITTTPEQRPVKSPECYSNKYTETAKKEVYNCY